MSLIGQCSLTRGDFSLETGRFEIPSSGLTAVFGHSGSGKTSFLRCLAGLETSVQGEIQFDDQVWLNARCHKPVHQRQLGYVFQEASLFSHLTVEQNLRYGWKRSQSADSGMATIQFEQVVDWLGLQEVLDRDVVTLSGGERQRVAIGRTLLSQPKILFMDEPMAALDLYAKRAIMPYLERLRDELAIPIIYVTHSPEEVERLADFVLFMAKGTITHFEPIEQALNRSGTPLYQNAEPRAVLSAQVIAHNEVDGLTHLQAGSAYLWVPKVANEPDDKVRVVISAQQVSLLAERPEQSSVLNHLPVCIESIEPLNEYSVLLRLRVAQEPWPLLAQVTKRSVNSLSLATGQHWIAAIKSASILN